MPQEYREYLNSLNPPGQDDHQQVQRVTRSFGCLAGKGASLVNGLGRKLYAIITPIPITSVSLPFRNVNPLSAVLWGYAISWRGGRETAKSGSKGILQISPGFWSPYQIVTRNGVKLSINTVNLKPWLFNPVAKGFNFWRISKYPETHWTWNCSGTP